MECYDISLSIIAKYKHHLSFTANAFRGADPSAGPNTDLNASPSAVPKVVLWSLIPLPS